MKSHKAKQVIFDAKFMFPLNFVDYIKPQTQTKQIMKT